MERMGNTNSPRRQENQEVRPQEEEGLNDHVMIDENSDSSSDDEGRTTYHILVDRETMRTIVHEDPIPLSYNDLNNEDSDSEVDSLVALQLLTRLFGANLRRR